MFLICTKFPLWSTSTIWMNPDAEVDTLALVTSSCSTRRLFFLALSLSITSVVRWRVRFVRGVGVNFRLHTIYH